MRLGLLLPAPLVLLALASGLASCAAPVRATVPELVTRAAFDLGCPPTLVQIYQLDRRARGVFGCGRRLAYVEKCEPVGGQTVCSWELDSPPPSSPFAGPMAPGQPQPTMPVPVPTVPGVPPATPQVAAPPPYAPPAPTDSGKRDFGF